MSIYNELSYNAQKVKIEEVRGVQFSVLGPDEIVKRSVVKVTKTDTYAGSEPIVGGLFDPRMGVLEHNKVCTTCEQKNVFCPGHFGHIELAKPVFHAMFFDIVKKILKCVCFRCSRMLISQHTGIEELKNEMTRILAIKNNQKRWEAYFKLCNTTTKIKICGDDKHIGCGSKQPDRYNKEASMKIIAEWKDKSKETSIQQEFTAEDVLRIFKRITNEDMELMGFNSKWNKPEWMICTVLPVPPPAVRPSIIEENGQRREDDLTHKLSDIIKTNNNIFDKITKGASEETIKLITMVLQYHVFTFIDNQIPGLAPSQQRNGRRLRSVCDRMKKKEGRIRGNLNGKRVDQSARSVITPDPYISIDELGVPIRVALNITFQETVNEYNIEEMRKLIMNGSNKWPGAKYVKKTNELGPINLKYADLGKIAAELHYGDVVHRHLNDGDYVLFNRQPSLHKMSMMCHKVIIMPYQTFRLNVLDTPPYNADFDGDEMNLHCPQNIQTMSELKDLAAVPYLILAPRDGKPSIEVVQDTLVGSFRASKDYVVVADKQMANLQMVNSYFKGKLEKPSKDYTYTGKDLFSEIMPPSLFIEMTNKAGEKVVINNSKLISGTLDKLVFHNITNGLIPVIYHDYGPVEIKKFLDNTQRLICRWLLTSGFSIGISDLVTDTSTDLELNDKIKEMKASAYKKLEDMRKGDLENNSIFSNEEFLEREIIGILNQTTNEVAKISLAKIDERTNRMFNMVKSGSKGKETNIAQIMACVGQQNVDGRRIAYGYTDRTLPHYTKYDDGPEARGFVENSFISGLSPQEVFFHAMGGREGLIDTAVKSVTGDTPIIIIENGECKCVNIGDWIDSKLDNPNNKKDIEQFGEEDMNMEMLGLSNNIYIPTADNDGNTSWGEVTAVTRHDPQEDLYKVVTQSGREIIVPNSKTLLIWNEKEFEAIKTEEVKIGDYVPTTISLPEPPIIINEIDMSLYFPKDDEKLNKFELNRENGVFIGLFIAVGNTRDFTGSVAITIDEPSLLEFVKNWFEKFNITYKIETTTIIGNSSLLARFLDKFVGTNCYNIPDIAHIAPKEFIVGLLDGYFSGDGSVSEDGEISLASSSEKLIQGISLLCNRLEIFGKLSIKKHTTTNLNMIDITEQWSRKFTSEITLTNKSKNKKLEINNNKTNLHKNYKEHNNIVLDKIINITILNPDEKINYTKLYDLTIPSTKNFMNITGLTVYDTSETGYIQRRLVKAMEDAKINYDNTVRNANGAIIQFIYGEDGMDGCKIETQLIPTIEMRFLDMEVKYNLTTADKLESYLTPEANKKITKQTFERCKEHFKSLVEDKNFIITKVNKNKKCSIINYPIPFNRIIKTCIKRRESSNIAATLTDLTPDYILDKIEELIENLYIKDTEQGMIYFHILLRVYLSPKKLIIEQNFSKSMFDWIVLQVYEYFKEAIAQPSEMVGIIAAQTIGEMGTQMTLDSFHVSGTAAAVKATSGVPRLKEILSATKKTKTPTLIIYMKPDVASVKNPKIAEDGIEYIDERIEQTKSIAMSIKNSIEITNLSNILEYSEIFWDSGKLDTTIDSDKGILDIYKKFAALDTSANKCRSDSPWVLRMKFNKEKMNAFGLRMIDIYTKLNKAYNRYIDCVYSDDNADECIFRIRLTEYALKDIENKDDVAALKAMEHNIVYQVLLKGVKGINKVSLNKKKYDIYNQEEETFDKVVEWVLDTDGTNLIEILSNPNIDSTRTISNDIREIYTVLGVEAARNALYHELVNVTAEGSMNYRHLSLLIDTMTFRGNLMSIDRHGINRNASSALSKSSFEESVDMLINASIFSEYDNTSGVSPQVMLGKVPNCGSGNFDIVLDEEHLMELIKNVKQTKENKYNLDDVIEDEDDDIDCLEENLAFNITINNKDECYNVKEPEIKII
jgi:DNA-directed RNA polymerase beta' subunit